MGTPVLELKRAGYSIQSKTLGITGFSSTFVLIMHRIGRGFNLNSYRDLSRHSYQSIINDKLN